MRSDGAGSRRQPVKRSVSKVCPREWIPVAYLNPQKTRNRVPTSGELLPRQCIARHDFVTQAVRC